MNRLKSTTPSRAPGGTSRVGPPLGAHLSVAGGIARAFESGMAIGADALQIFVKNQRQWVGKPLTDTEVAEVRRAAGLTGLSPVVAHATYLLNLASPDEALRARSVATTIDELQRCHALGVTGLVLHPGASMDATPAEGIRRIIQSLNDIARRAHGLSPLILLETTAGQGTSIGSRFEQLADIVGGVTSPERLGVCLDTCHLFAAGYDFRTPQGYADMIGRLDDVIGMARVQCVHANDSRHDCGSRRDRHEHIGKGRIGRDGFAHFLRDPRFAEIPFILETPKGKDGRGTDFDKVNIRRLRKLAQA